ncbi:Crp/Fnr family transcriptional regulator [Algicella marina]|uniref:Cyclic nucleotide-binding domain-containing protein n=1 Tax=Algicella marina TaxID=2683284 RepID=A0A6P1T5U5_9RHOB|nr:Crp/Fnr family transcriptional regulator [Algicella marina]QHQ37181.1 cyclic nucleotide-binding domain-containing protein [Algicella marina]
MSVPAPAEILTQCALFASLGEEQIRSIAKRCTLRTTRKGEVLFSQGDDSDSLYIMVEGAATISLLSETGREMIFHIAKPGDSIGEIALLDGEPRSATCTIRDVGRVLALRRADFVALLEDPALSRGIITTLCMLLRRSTDRAEFLALRPLRARVAHVLMGNAVPDGPRPPQVRLTQQELALMCGAARPRVNQILKALEAEEVISKNGRIILLSDMEQLEDIAQELDEL